MVKKFTRTEAQRRAIEKALARMDKRRQDAAAKAHARATATSNRRRRERKEAKPVPAFPNIFGKGARNEDRQKLALPAWQVICARMDPGVWYAVRDVRALCPEYATSTIKFQLMNGLPDRGLVQRAGNPDFTGEMAWPAVTVPRYLYALTPAGQEQGQDARKVLGE